MAVSKYSPNQISRILNEWFERKSLKHVLMEEKFGKNQGTNSDYVEVYSCIFEPQNLHEARVEVFLTEDGLIGFGLEKWSRLFLRKNRKTNCVWFVAGKEPHTINSEALLRLLELFSRGSFYVKGFAFPVFGIQSSKVFINSDLMDQIRSTGYEIPNWLKIAKNQHEKSSATLFRFKQWE